MNKGNPIRTALRRRLAEIGAQHFATADHIDVIRENIELNRNGQLDLDKVAVDRDRALRRVAREAARGPGDAVERVNGVADFQDVSIVSRMLGLSRAVCRVLVGSAQGSSGYGTGFLIAPRVLITNHHVLEDAATASRSFAQFGYELDTTGNALAPVSFRLKPDELFVSSSLEKRAGDRDSGLDFTMVAVEPVNAYGQRLDEWGHVCLDGTLGKITDGETCAVIQHPDGDYKKIVLKDIRMITVTDDTLLYESDTRPGSSGSPVFGMGTCEVVALHHTGVPRMNGNGDWLTRDGRVAGPGDSDDDIDWIGNEGIRVSRILAALREAQLPDGMHALRGSVLSAIPPPPNAPPPAKSTATDASAQTPTTMPLTVPADAALLRFEVLLNPRHRLRDAWEDDASMLVEGYVSDEPLFPTSTHAYARRLRYLIVRRSGDAWAIAEEIERLPHVTACTPDLPTPTHMEPDGERAAAMHRDTEGAVPDVIYDDGTGEHNEGAFITKWSSTKLISGMGGKTELIRNWNWAAINFNGIDALPPSVKDKVTSNLGRIRFAQLDTGYSDHTKLSGGFNLDLDQDMIDADTDARDRMRGAGFKQPGHGTRTASLAVGGSLKENHGEVDGNRGVLREADGTVRARLIPYRVAERVVLIGSGKDMVDGARHAISAGTDVLFMCMGSYPRPMIEAVAREAYERGVIWVCAAGNEVEVVVAPAMYPGTIAVAAINPQRHPWKGSSNGSMVDIAAPGEDVYVPIWDKHKRECMSYGNGTSYATPHVASAAVLWKAHWMDQLREKYNAPWQVVEAFRHCLKASATDHEDLAWAKIYGKGVLDIGKLMDTPLPDAAALTYAYQNIAPRDPDDLGVREGLHYLWGTLRRKLRGGPAESAAPLSARATHALEAMGALRRRVGTEGTAREAAPTTKILREIFHQ